MFQVLRRTVSLRRDLVLGSVRATHTKVKIPDEEEYKNAIPFEKVPGPKPLPLIGIAHHFLPGGQFYKMGMVEMHRQMRKRYGDVVMFKGVFGREDIVFLFNPKDIELIFRTEGKWPYRRALEVLDEFRFKERPDLFKGIGGLIQDQGEAWKDTRTKVNPVMMQPKNVKSYVPVVHRIADEFVERIRAIRNENSEVPADFSNETNKWSLESIASIALDQRLHLMTDDDPKSDGQRLITAVHDFFSLAFDIEMQPSIWKYYKTPQFKRLTHTMHEMTNLITKLIDKTIEELKDKDAASEEESVLEKLLKIDKRVAIVMALDMLMAGVDTTSSATLGVLYQLAKNPDKQEKLRQEVLEKLPNKDSQLTAELMVNMPYLRAVIKESLRMRPVAGATARKSIQNLVLSGYAVPKGVDMIMSQMLMSENDQFFGRGSEFLPERFLKEKSNPELKGDNPFAFLPFGFGTRMCIGKRFAELELEIVISKIVRNYQIEWHYPDMKYVSKMIYVPTGDLKFRFVDL